MLAYKSISKNGKLSNSEQFNINQCLNSSQIYISSSNNSLTPYCLYYNVDSLYDCIKLLQFSITLDYFNLIINTNTHSFPFIHFNFFDTIGEDYTHSNTPTESTSYLINTPQAGHFNLIVGNSRESIIDSFNKIIDLVIQYPHVKELHLGLFLSQVNPNKYLNRGFKLHRLKELYLAFNSSFNKFNLSPRLYIELTKSLLTFTTNTQNIKYNYYNSVYQTFTVNRKNVLNKIVNDNYIAPKLDLINRLNQDLIDRLNPSTNLNELVSDLYLKTYKGNYITFISNESLLQTRKGLIGADKLTKHNFQIQSNHNWCFGTISKELGDVCIYVVFFTDNSAIEVVENSKVVLKNGEVKAIRELAKGDRLLVDKIKQNDNDFITNGIVSEVAFERVDHSCVKISLSSRYSPNITLGNGINLSAVNIEQTSISSSQIEARLSDKYPEATCLSQNSIVLDSKVNLCELPLFNITEQLKIFKAATLISGSGLILPEHNLCPKLQDNLTFNPLINVCVEHIQRFYYSFTNACKAKTITISDTTDLKFLQLYQSKKIDNLLELSVLDNQLSFSGLSKHKYILPILLELWKSEVESSIAEYCVKHNLAIPRRITSIYENEKFKYNAIEQLNIILNFHKLYSTQNSIFTIYYSSNELSNLSNAVTKLFKHETNLPYLLFHKVD